MPPRLPLRRFEVGAAAEVGAVAATGAVRLTLAAPCMYTRIMCSNRLSSAAERTMNSWVCRVRATPVRADAYLDVIGDAQREIALVGAPANAEASPARVAGVERRDCQRKRRPVGVTRHSRDVGGEGGGGEIGLGPAKRRESE